MFFCLTISLKRATIKQTLIIIEMKTKIFAICLLGMAIATSCNTVKQGEKELEKDVPEICTDSLMPSAMTAADILFSVTDKGYIKDGKYFSEKDGKVPDPDGVYSVIETAVDGTVESLDTIKVFFKK